MGFANVQRNNPGHFRPLTHERFAQRQRRVPWLLREEKHGPPGAPPSDSVSQLSKCPATVRCALGMASRSCHADHLAFGHMKTVDLIYFNAGGGHRAAAQALEEAMRQRPWRVRMVHLTGVLEPSRTFRRITVIEPEDLAAPARFFSATPAAQVGQPFNHTSRNDTFRGRLRFSVRASSPWGQSGSS